MNKYKMVQLNISIPLVWKEALDSLVSPKTNYIHLIRGAVKEKYNLGRFTSDPEYKY